MDLCGPQLLTNILTPNELDLVPGEVQDKLKNYLDGFFDEYCKEKAAANRLSDYEKKTEELQGQIQDYEIKLQHYSQNVDELRTQLDKTSTERAQLFATTNTYERELESMRREKNAVVDERDSLMKVIERQTTELERQQQEIRSYQQQLKAAINAKCDAIARLDEIESKESALDFKERRMEQERTMLQNQIQTLSEDLNRNILELQKIRRENTMQNMHSETKLSEKTEELKILQSQCVQYKETIDRLTQNVQELSTKIRNQNEEANKMMEYYKKELDAKTKLADLYKGNYEDIDLEKSELGTAIGDLKRMLAEASDQYGELETKLKATTLKFELELEEKNKMIDSQKSEILHANDLLKEVQNDSVENAISKIAPSAAVASRLIRADMSLTELYSLYVKTSENLELQKRENSRLSLQLKTILHELGENAPLIKKQELQYEKLIETNNILSHQRDDLLAKKSDLEEMLDNAQSKIGHLERENKKLKHSQNDLSRQVCYLLKEVEQLRLGLTADNNSSQLGNPSTTAEVISKKLVTFSNVTELQENNQKLLLLVRDLSNKLEEAENLKSEINESSYKEKVENCYKKLQNMQDTLNQQNNTVSVLVAKCERYKKMYFDVQKKFNKSALEDDLSDPNDSEMNEETVNADATRSTANTSKGASQLKDSSASGENDKRILALEKQLEEVKGQYKIVKDQYEYYIQEKKNNEKIMNEQFDSMRTEVRELTSTNCKLMSTVEYTGEQIKLQQKNIATYRQQIAALEDRNKNYENTIVKHEQSLLYLKDEIMNAQKSHSASEAEANHLRHENRILKDTVSRLQSEKESYHRERQSQNLLLNNLELIKANLERSEIEGRARLEKRLDDATRELSAQRRRFHEEEDRFREITADLKRQAETAKERMEEEKSLASKLREELIAVRKEVSQKANEIDELSRKLQESLTPSKNDNPIMLANKKVRALEMKIEEAQIEISSLNSELTKAREHADQYYKISHGAETEIKNLHNVHTNFVAQAEAEIAALKQSELDLKSRIEELESEVQLSSVADTSKNTNKSDQLNKLQEEFKDALQKLTESNRSLRSLRSECSTLKDALNAVETKYANEMVLHSADIQEMARLKAEVNKFQDVIKQLTCNHESVQLAYDELKNSNKERFELLNNEKEDLEKRVTELNSLNSTLHDQIEALTAKLSCLSRQMSTNSSLSEPSSKMDTSTPDANTSQTDSENKCNEQLLQIIKFLRKEKDLSVAKLDILKAENVRLISEHTILQKKIDEVTGFLNQERTKSDTVTVTALKHEEILRKIETLNALTDSNRILREERDSLAARVKELNDRISKVEDELFPLQKQNREFVAKIEEVTSENNSLRTEAIKWRQRANVLVEKSNKNPEEFKRLQNERENLAKMLTHEKEVIKQANEELSALKSEKSRLEAELNNFQKQLQALNDDKKKITDDYNSLKATHSRLVQEIMELKNKLLQKEEALQKISEDLEGKEAQLQDSKNKEIQIRKIAKRYKDSYLELSHKTTANTSIEANAATSQDNMELGTNNSTDCGSVTPSANSELDQLRNTIDGLNNVIRTMQEENDKVKKDYDDLKASAEIDDRTKTLLREAKSRIVSLTESKHVVSQELASTKTKLQSYIQSSEDHDATINGIKSQYEETFARMEKELVDHSNQSKETIARLTRENEALLMRVNQLSRQLGLQQSSKPSTSCGTISDKNCMSESSPRTANVKPMSGSATVQQSATVTPWRGSETPLASIRPISVQNSRTAAILPTSQQNTSGSSSTTSTSSSAATTSTPGCSNTALVPPQQQVHTTGTNSIESISSSPTSSHTDYMPSTSSASVAVAAVPPMGSAAAAESSQEAESLQQQQTNESQLIVSGGQQVVALVSPRVEGSTQNVQTPISQIQQEPTNQQPSTSGSSSTCHVVVSSHSRHVPSSSNVTTTQATGSTGGHKRPREIEGDSSTSADENGGAEKSKHPKRTRTQMQSGEAAVLVGVSESGVDIEYQVPTSSQRDQEDDIVVVDSEEEDGVVDEGNAEADDGPVDGDGENERYEDIYEQDQDDENDCPDIVESNIQAEVDNNEVYVDECIDEKMHCALEDNQVHIAPDDSGASTSKAMIRTLNKSDQQENNQQSQAISSGSCEPSQNMPQAGISTWKQTASLYSRQQRNTLMMYQPGINDDTENEQGINPEFCGSQHSESFNDGITSPQELKFNYAENVANSEDVESKAVEGMHEGRGDRDDRDNVVNKKEDEAIDEKEKLVKGTPSVENINDCVYSGDLVEEEGSISVDETLETESHNSNGATQSEIQEFQHGRIEGTEENEGADGVSSEGEKQTVDDDMEEEGREAEASTSPSINTRSKTTRGSGTPRRPSRVFQRGGRPTPIVWQENMGHSRHLAPNQRNMEQPGSPSRGYPNQRAQRARRLRRPAAGNYGNMRYS